MVPTFFGDVETSGSDCPSSSSAVSSFLSTERSTSSLLTAPPQVEGDDNPTAFAWQRRWIAEGFPTAEMPLRSTTEVVALSRSFDGAWPLRPAERLVAMGSWRWDKYDGPRGRWRSGGGMSPPRWPSEPNGHAGAWRTQTAWKIGDAQQQPRDVVRPFGDVDRHRRRPDGK